MKYDMTCGLGIDGGLTKVVAEMQGRELRRRALSQTIFDKIGPGNHPIVVKSEFSDDRKPSIESWRPAARAALREHMRGL